MRWAAALLVFGTHVRILGYFGGDAAKTVQTTLGPGTTGVSFFFILSGFVLAWTARPNDPAPSFWRRRIARIYPLHLATIAVILLLAWTVLPSARPNPFTFFANLFLVQSWSGDQNIYQSMNTVSWSLACEAFFYALFPLLWWGLRRLQVRGTVAATILCVLVVIALPVLFGEQSFGAPLDFLPLARLPEFILGMALGRLMQLRPGRGPGALPALGVLATGYFLTNSVPHQYRYAACTVVGFALLIYAGAASDLRERPSLWRLPLMVRLGEISYAFYMVHLLVMRAAESIVGSHPRLDTGPALTLSLTAFTVALAAAWLFHNVVELPGQQLILGRRRLPWARRPEPAHHPVC
jgi:peptidoglycan/LPS O-acetylase OafA/YrhL